MSLPSIHTGYLCIEECWRLSSTAPRSREFQWPATEVATPHGSDYYPRGPKASSPVAAVRRDIAEGTLMEYSNKSAASRHCTQVLFVRRSSQTWLAMCNDC
jgi:hypothetical protein